jgi:hypothetical protein
MYYATANAANAAHFAHIVALVGDMTGNQQELACKIFNANLPTLDVTVRTTAWRTMVVRQIMVANQCTLGSASTAYNYAKKKAVQDGLTVDFARSAKIALTTEVDVQPKTPATEGAEGGKEEQQQEEQAA